MQIKRCDVCSKFSQDTDLESIEITITKHKDCDVNNIFKQSQAPQERLNLPRVIPTVVVDDATIAMPVIHSSMPPGLASELAEIQRVNDEMNEQNNV